MRTQRLIYLVSIFLLFSTVDSLAKRITPIVISEVMYDSPLNEDGAKGMHHNGEFVELFNMTERDVDLSGWTLSDCNSRYTIPDKTIIKSRSPLLIAFRYPGSNFDISSLYPTIGTGTILYQDNIQLSNDGESITLKDKAADIIDAMTYRQGSTFNPKKNDFWCFPAHNGERSSGYILSIQRSDVIYSTSGITSLQGNYSIQVATPLKNDQLNNSPILDDIYDNLSLDTSLPVGTIPGQATVSPIGAATYQIPIDLPVGTNGCAPKISIVYNSQSGYGALGRGWDISGVSAISRVPKNMYYNGRNEATIQFDNNDELALDGQRLILIKGTHLSVGAEYATEIENYSRVTIESSNFGISFKLTTKDGQTFLYGKSTDSRVTNSNSGSDTRVLSWKLNKSTNIFGSSISYFYSNHGQYLQQINYVGNTNSEINTINFNYYALVNTSSTENTISTPSIIPQHFTGTFLTKQDRLLKSIEILSKENISSTNTTGKLREYQMKYSISDIDVKFNTITLVSGTGIKLNSTKINWGASPSKKTPRLVTLAKMDDSNLNNVNNASLYTGDIDGDGYTDKIEMWTGSEATNEDGYIRVVLKNKSLPLIRFRSTNRLYENYEPQLVIGDFDNDGKDEICLTHLDNMKCYKINTKNDAISKIVESDYMSPCGRGEDDYSYKTLIKDVNSDGYPDLLFIPYKADLRNIDSGDCVQPSVDVFYSSKNLFDPQAEKHSDIGVNVVRGVYNQMIGDFNADGKIDFMNLLYAGSSTLHSIDFEMTEAEKWGNYLYYEPWLCKPKNLTQSINSIDFNNDGLTDLISQYNNDKHTPNRYAWFILKNNGGINQAPSKISLDLPRVSDQEDNERHNMFTIDYNGDGFTDVIIADEICKDKKTFQFTDWYFYRNTGSKFVSDGTLRTTDRISKMNPVYMDINNDGVMDLVMGAGDSYKAFTVPNTSNQYYVSSITDGDGFSYRFSYKNISNSTATSCPSNVRNIKSPMWLVDTYTDKDGSTTTYSYGAPKFHTMGKGFLGFESISSSTIPSGLTTTTTYEIDSKHYALSLKSHEVKNTSSSAVISFSQQTNKLVDSDETSNAIQEGLNGENRYLPLVTYSISNDYTKGITQESTSNTFDANWNVTKLTEVRGDATKITETSYKARANQSLLTLPEYVTVTQKRTGMPDIVCNTTYSDYNSAGQAKTKTTYPGTDGEIKTEYDYYSTGNLKSVTVTPVGCAKQKTTYNYDTDKYYRYVSSEVTSYNDAAKIANQTTSMTYDFGTGNVLSKTGANGLTTYYHYDSYGVLDYETQPNGEIIYYTKTWTSDHGAMYKNTVSYKNNKSTKSVYYDYLGREIYTEETSWDGKKTLISSKQYNSKGLLGKSIMPRYSNETKSLYTDYEYDVLERPTTVSTFDGTNTLVTTSDYNNTTTTITPPNSSQVKTITTDAQGLVVRRSDAGGAITYTYDAAGKLRYIQSNGSTIEIKYDAYGNQQTLIDPDAGTIRYHYFSNGKLKSEINAKGDSTALVYDDAGRLDTKTVTEYKTGIVTETHYTYVASGNGIGQPLSVTMTVGGNVKHSVSYSYNSHHQIETTTETYDGNTITSRIGYDNLWRPEIYTSPSGLVTTNVYNDYGSIYQVKKGSSVIWEGTDVNNKGQFTGFTLGNGLITTRTYSDRGELTGISTNFKNVTTNYVQKASYVYDPNTGNLTERNDERNGRDEFFSYDTSDRLTSITLNGVNTYSMTYKANGNIDTKSDVGTYGYGTNGGGPHALSKIKGIQSGVSTDKQFLEYTSFQKVSQIKQGVDVNTITKEYDIYYGLDEERIKTVYTNGTATQTRYYFGSYEKTIKADGTVEETDYIYTPSGLTCLNKTTNNVSTLYYLHTDLLGSITAITNTTGNVVTSYAYTAWGERKLLSGDNTITDRGYTFHEHLEGFGLINMNGRMYDPVLARFLSPDPYVQSPDNSQSLNRYSYCLNNPFKYTDPSGKFWNFVIAAAIGGTINLISQIASGNVANLGDALKAFGVGALAGLAGAGAGALAASAVKVGGFIAGAASGAAGGAAGGFVSGVGNAAINGQSAGDALMAGVKGGAIGAVSGAAMGGLMRGISDSNNGYDFWDGHGEAVDVTMPVGPNQANTQLTPQQIQNLNSPDNLLKVRVDAEYGVKTGDMGLMDITTKAPSGMQVGSNGQFVSKNALKFTSCDGRTVPYSSGHTKMYVSPRATAAYHYDRTFFRSVVGHELNHVYHYSIGLPMNNDFSDMVAYKYSYDTYVGAGRYNAAEAIKTAAINKGQWGIAPVSYQVPSIYRFSSPSYFNNLHLTYP